MSVAWQESTMSSVDLTKKDQHGHVEAEEN
jgi:hypothetical protein